MSVAYAAIGIYRRVTTPHSAHSIDIIQEENKEEEQVEHLAVPPSPVASTSYSFNSLPRATRTRTPSLVSSSSKRSFSSSSTRTTSSSSTLHFSPARTVVVAPLLSRAHSSDAGRSSSIPDEKGKGKGRATEEDTEGREEDEGGQKTPRATIGVKESEQRPVLTPRNRMVSSPSLQPEQPSPLPPLPPPPSKSTEQPPSSEIKKKRSLSSYFKRNKDRSPSSSSIDSPSASPGPSAAEKLRKISGPLTPKKSRS